MATTARDTAGTITKIAQLRVTRTSHVTLTV